MTFRNRILGGVVALLFVLTVAAACGPSEEREPAPQFTGTFNGVNADGQPVVISFEQDGNTLTGNGRWGDQEIGLSALTAPGGPMVVGFASGHVASGNVALAADGKTVTVRGLGAPVTLDRGGEPVADASGRFAGRFVTKAPTYLELQLVQAGELLAGTGFVAGRPVAVAGKVTEADRARGFVLFADESRNGVTVTLSDGGASLSVRGLGQPVEMKRK